MYIALARLKEHLNSQIEHVATVNAVQEEGSTSRDDSFALSLVLLAWSSVCFLARFKAASCKAPKPVASPNVWNARTRWGMYSSVQACRCGIGGSEYLSFWGFALEMDSECYNTERSYGRSRCAGILLISMQTAFNN